MNKPLHYKERRAKRLTTNNGRQNIRVITKLPNSEQFYKGKVKTHKYINRQNQSTTEKLDKCGFTGDATILVPLVKLLTLPEYLIAAHMFSNELNLLFSVEYSIVTAGTFEP
jgi:hypothetical protein